MRSLAITLVLCTLTGAPAFAQIVPQVPDLSNRIPAPLPPPERPPIINGPIPPSQQPGGWGLRRGHARSQQKLNNTFGDRVNRCLHNGSTGGLRGADLDAYTRACANDY